MGGEEAVEAEGAVDGGAVAHDGAAAAAYEHLGGLSPRSYPS